MCQVAFPNITEDERLYGSGGEIFSDGIYTVEIEGVSASKRGFEFCRDSSSCRWVPAYRMECGVPYTARISFEEGYDLKSEDRVGNTVKEAYVSEPPNSWSTSSACININDESTPHSPQIEIQYDQNGEPLYPRLYKQTLAVSSDCPDFTTPAGDYVEGGMNVFYTHKKIDPPGASSCQVVFPIGNSDGTSRKNGFVYGVTAWSWMA